jgi:hypothetical protein
MENCWIDYLLPQLYWSIDHKTASYAKLIKWWAENSTNTAIYIGNGSYKVNTDSDKKWNIPSEIPNQIDLTRTYKNIGGNAFFSAKSFVNRNKAVTDLLLQNQYKYPALPYVVPNSRRTDIEIPKVSTITTNNFISTVTLNYPLLSKIRYVMVYSANESAKLNINNPSQIVDKIAFTERKDSISITIPQRLLEKGNISAITYIDYFGNESEATLLNKNTETKTSQSHSNDENR